MERLLKVKRTFKDTVSDDKKVMPDERLRHEALLNRCQTLWNNLQQFRDRRDRVYRYVYDSQWEDVVYIDGQPMTEREYINKMGNFAFEVNLLKRQVDQVSGLYAKEMNEPLVTARNRAEQQYGLLMATVLQANWQLNEMPALYETWFQELACGGLAVAEECYATRDGYLDAWTDPVPVTNFFMDCSFDDPRFKDMSLIGHFRDFTWKEMVKRYGIKPGALDKLMQYYPDAAHPANVPLDAEPERRKQMERASFLTCPDPTRCRVFEVWTKEERKRIRCHDWATGDLYIVDANDREKLLEIQLTNKTRQAMYAAQGYDERETPVIDMEPFIEDYWYYRHLTPNAEVLEEGESQIETHTHPYSVCAIPLVNGNMSGFMADKINYQRAINRFLMLDDWVRRSGAKGLTMVDERLVPEWMDKREFARAWTSVNGILLYSGKVGVDAPKQFYASTQSLDTPQLIQLFKGLLDDSSPASSGALQGKTPYAGTSAALYAQQSQNASTGLASLYLKYNMFQQCVGRKKLYYIKATYTPQQYQAIADELSVALPQDFDYTEVPYIDYKLVVKQSTETPEIRMLDNDKLDQLFQLGQITLEEYLKYSNGLSFADALLQDRLAQQGTQPQGGAPMQGQQVPQEEQQGYQLPQAIGGAQPQVQNIPQPDRFGYGGRELA